MFICRDLDGKNRGPDLHVHDIPGSLVDAQRNADNGWHISPLDTCGLPTLPWRSGDTKVNLNPTILALTYEV